LLVELVEQVARRVIHAELTLQPQQLLHLVSEALSGLQGESVGVQIFLNPTIASGWPPWVIPSARVGRWRPIRPWPSATVGSRVRTAWPRR
jgi:flagellar assembly protein FliH